MSWSLQARCHQALHQPGRDGRFCLTVNLLIATMVVLNMAEVVWLSIPEYGDQYQGLAAFSMQVFIVFFAMEYALRVWSAGYQSGDGEFKLPNPRFRYIFSPMGLIDLLSFLPTMLVWFLPTDEFGDMRVLKMIAIVRVVKLTRYSDSLSMLARLYKDNRQTLFAAAMVMIILSFLSATGIYLFERNAQPDAFGSIPSCMWWALVTLTTVGYGDMTPITLGGKLFGVLVMISGVGIAAMPAGIFASSFVQLIREQEHERRLAARRKKARRHGKSEAEIDQELKVKAGSLSVDLFSRSDKREIEYLITEFGLSFEQAAGVVMHYRH